MDFTTSPRMVSLDKCYSEAEKVRRNGLMQKMRALP